MSVSFVRRAGEMTVVAGAMSLITATDACAYIDFGSGSFLFQLILAGFLGALYALRAYVRRLRDRIVGFIGRARRPHDRTGQDDPRP